MIYFIVLTKYMLLIIIYDLHFKDPTHNHVFPIWQTRKYIYIFRQYSTDYRFKGTNGLKSVLPVVVPGMGYSNLDVQEGSQAQVVWEQMINLTDGDEKDILIQQLLEYCQLDTLAMVEIHKMLMKHYKGEK